MTKLRWGILGAANIARWNWKSIHDSGNAIVTAVASRSIERSRKFIADCQAETPFDRPPVALGRYDELIARDTVDAIYIPLPTGLRKPWVLRAAAAGKHVLCEKPCGTSAAEVEEITAACRQHGVQFMDGVMFMHNPRLDRVREVLDEGRSVGDIKRITSYFSFYMDEDRFEDNVRVNSDLEPAGCLGDLGWYSIRFTLWAKRWELPRRVTGHILEQRGSRRSPAPVPTQFSSEMVFQDGSSASFYCSFCAKDQNWVNVAGTKGWLAIPDFVHPRSHHEPGFLVNGQEARVRHCQCVGPHDDSASDAQATKMIRHFVDQARSGELNEEWPRMVLKTQRVLDACLESARTQRPVEPRGEIDVSGGPDGQP